MDPITIQNFVYVLECSDGVWYIGQTFHLNIRYAQHKNGTGARWTRLHPPIRIARVILDKSENEVTKDYIALFGAANVRGGSWTKC